MRTNGERDGDDTRLSRIDPRSNRVVDVVAAAPGDTLAVGGEAVWVDRRWRAPEGIERIDADAGAVAGRNPLRDADGIAIANGDAWAVAQNGTVARIDAASARIERRWSQLAASPVNSDGSETITADAAGAWILRIGESAVYRLEGDRITRRLTIDAAAKPVFAATRGGLWIAAEDEVRGRHRVVRIDPASGEQTAIVDLGAHRPQALVPVAGGLWVVGGDGTAVLIKT